MYGFYKNMIIPAQLTGREQDSKTLRLLDAIPKWEFKGQSISDQIEVNLVKWKIWIEFESAFDLYSLFVCVLKKYHPEKHIERKDVIGLKFSQFTKDQQWEILHYAGCIKPIISSTEITD